MSIQPQYSEKLIDHFENPRNVGSLDEDLSDVGAATMSSKVCGDVTMFHIRAGDDGVITDAKFKTFGCAAAIASGSLATTMLIGKTLDHAARLRSDDIAGELELPQNKLHCAELTADAIHAAVADRRRKNQADS